MAGGRLCPHRSIEWTSIPRTLWLCPVVTLLRGMTIRRNDTHQSIFAVERLLLRRSRMDPCMERHACGAPVVGPCRMSAAPALGTCGVCAALTLGPCMVCGWLALELCRVSAALTLGP